MWPTEKRRTAALRAGALLAAVALSLAASACGGTAPQRGTVTSAVIKTAPSHSTAATASGSPLIVDFAHPKAGDVSLPGVGGASFVYDWDQLEPTPGQYQWSLIDSDLAPWLAAGKQVVIRVVASAQHAFEPSSTSATPSWVYSAGARSVVDADGERLPVYWDPTFQHYYLQFVSALGARYDGTSGLAFVQAGIGEDGETLPDTLTSESVASRLARWQAAGYTDALWDSTITTIVGAYKKVFTRTPVAIMIDSTFLGPTRTTYYNQLMASLTATTGLLLQTNGLLAGSVPPPSWQGSPTVAEQRDDIVGSPVTVSAAVLALCRDAISQFHTRDLILYRSDIVAAGASTMQQCAAILGS